MTVRFAGNEYPDDLTVAELAEKLGEHSGFKVVGNAYKRNIELETYEPVNKRITAQQLIDEC